jgi:hypothetical protein
MKKFVLWLTGICILIYLYLSYLGESVAAWTVLPWMIVVFIDQYEDYKKSL